MKTKIEVNGFEIEIQENEENGVVTLNVTRDGEPVDEMSLDPAEFTDEEGSKEESEEGSDEVKSFGDFGGETDLGNEESEEAEEAQEEEEEQVEESATTNEDFKSFQDFINKK